MSAPEKCRDCAGTGVGAEPENKCGTCAGNGELIDCSVCRTQQPERQGVPGAEGICRACWGDHRASGRSIEQLRAQWAGEHAGVETDLFTASEAA